jgi:hypothetical protein
MKKFSKRSVLLFGAVLAVCAFAVPSLASAASWDGGGTVTHQLASANLGFTIEAPQVIGSSCANSEFDSDVVSAATLRITGARFLNCRGTGLGVNCTVTPTGRNFPWTATAPTTTTIGIDGVHVSVAFENHPDGTACGVNGLTTTLTGNLTGGSWDPSATGANRRVTFRNAPGTTSHSSLGSNAAFVTGDIRDTAGTLNLFM